MALTHFYRKPACRRAEKMVKKIVAGEAGPEELNGVARHLSGCPTCSRRFRKTLAVANALGATLSNTAERFGKPKPLDLPPRQTVTERKRPFTSILTDLSLLIVIGLGLFLLVAIAVLGYQSIARTYEQSRIFTALQDVVRLTRAGNRLVRSEPDLTLPAIVSRLEGMRQHGRREITLEDPWGSTYVCSLQNGAFSVRSSGPNREDEAGTGDDITGQGDVPSLGRPRRMPEHPQRR